MMMTVKKWKFIDKATWAKGPWQQEPDKIQWIDEETGFPCLIVRGASGALGGYVGVLPGNPLFQKPHNTVYIYIHGALSYSNYCQKGGEHGICYVSDSNEHEPIWWFGFTCNQIGDIRPAKDDFYGEYRDITYVTQEVISLAQQLRDVSRRIRPVTTQPLANLLRI